MVYIDTEREKQLNIGPDWPYGPLAEDECIASDKFENSYQVKIGDTINFHYKIDHSL